MSKPPTVATAGKNVGSKNTGVLGLKQQAVTLLPKTLCTEKLYQVANLVRNKTHSTLQNRFSFRPSNSGAQPPPPKQLSRGPQVASIDEQMPMEVLLSAADGDQQRPPTMAETRMDTTTTTSSEQPNMVRSETFDCPADSDVTILQAVASPQPAHQLLSGMAEHTFEVLSSTPNPNETKTRTTSSSSQIVDTTETVLDVTDFGSDGGEHGNRASLHLDVIGPNTLSTPCNGGVNGLLKTKLKQGVQHRLDMTFFGRRSICSPVPASSDATWTMDQTDDVVVAAASSTMVLAAPARLPTDDIMGNLTEVLETNHTLVDNRTHLLSEVTLTAFEDQRMDVDDGTISTRDMQSSAKAKNIF